MKQLETNLLMIMRKPSRMENGEAKEFYVKFAMYTNHYTRDYLNQKEKVVQEFMHAVKDFDMEKAQTLYDYYVKNKYDLEKDIDSNKKSKYCSNFLATPSNVLSTGIGLRKSPSK